MQTQNNNAINQVSDLLLESMLKVRSAEGKELKEEIETAKTVASLAAQFTNLKKTELAIYSYASKQSPVDKKTLLGNTIELENNTVKPKKLGSVMVETKQLPQSTQKKSIDPNE